MFSIILNNYNYAAYVGEAIESVLSQDDRDFELIVVDDGSTDDSREVINRFKDKRIVRIFKENGGQGSAFQAGIDRARGQWLAFLDSDDSWSPQKLSQCAAVLAKDPAITYLVHSYDEVHESGAKTVPHVFSRPGGYYDPMPDFARLDLKLPFVPTSFFCTTLAAAKAVVFDPKEWRICADLPFMGGLPVVGRTYVLNERLGRYRIHEKNHFAGRNSERGIADTMCRLYECLSKQLAAQGDSRRFDFRKSSYFLAQEVLSTPRASIRGLETRLRLWQARRRERLS